MLKRKTEITMGTAGSKYCHKKEGKKLRRRGPGKDKTMLGFQSVHMKWK
jgi:hypothetical protein